MIIAFITALAWIWGVIYALAFVILNVCYFLDIPIPGHVTSKQCANALAVGSPAWAWLLARYILL